MASPRWLPIGRRSALRTPARKTENNVPAWVSRRHFCRSIQSRFRYQSSSVGGSSLSVIDRPPSRSSIPFVQRTTTRRTYQPAPACSRGGFVLVDQPAEEISAVHTQRQCRLLKGCRPVGRDESEGAVGPVLVVMPHVETQHALEMTAANDKDSIEAVRADSSHPAFGVRVRVRRPNRRPDHLHPVGTEDLVERAAELRVAIVDQKPERLLIAEFHYQVARLLRRPAAIGVRRTSDVLDPSSRQRNEEQHIDPVQEGGLNGEEVAGQRGRRLLA